MSGPTVAIMQPTYLPYLGYFELIALCDVFVLLDDVQFQRRSWQSRNRILTVTGELMLSVPVRSHPRETPIAAIELAEDQSWRDTHLSSIHHAYAGRPGVKDALSLMGAELGGGATRLADLTSSIIATTARRIGLPTRFVRATSLGCGARRSDHLVEICRRLEASAYLSTGGSRAYIEADAAFTGAGLEVRYHEHAPAAYPQAGGAAFTPYMSFVDALANTGWAGLSDLVRAVERP